VTQLKLDAALTRLARLDLTPAPVLCADTTVALGRAIFGKPQHQAQATAMLRALAGRTHTVLTALALGNATQRWRALSRSRVTFAPLSDPEIASYVATGEPMGKAGAYAVQGRAAAHIPKISGSFSGVMGLPLFETASLLRVAGCLF
jgi:septum formation protein